MIYLLHAVSIQLQFTNVLLTSDSSHVWNNPFKGQIRLSSGSFSNEGLVEIYCNEQWGTVCSTTFGTFDANAACKQLGYSSFYQFNLLPMSVKLK